MRHRQPLRQCDRLDELALHRVAAILCPIVFELLCPIVTSVSRVACGVPRHNNIVSINTQATAILGKRSIWSTAFSATWRTGHRQIRFHSSAPSRPRFQQAPKLYHARVLAASVQVGALVPFIVLPEPAISKRMPHEGKYTSVEKRAKDCEPEPVLDLTGCTDTTSLEWSSTAVMGDCLRYGDGTHSHASMPTHDNQYYGTILRYDNPRFCAYLLEPDVLVYFMPHTLSQRMHLRFLNRQ